MPQFLSSFGLLHASLINKATTHTTSVYSQRMCRNKNTTTLPYSHDVMAQSGNLHLHSSQKEYVVHIDTKNRKTADYSYS